MSHIQMFLEIYHRVLNHLVSKYLFSGASPLVAIKLEESKKLKSVIVSLVLLELRV